MLPCRQIQQIRHRFFKYATKWTEHSYRSINIDGKRTKFVLSQCNELLFWTCSRHLSQNTEPVENEFLTHELVDEYKLQNFSRIRNVLFPYTDDIVLNKLKSCNSLKELFSTIEQHSPVNPQHLAQAVLTYRDITKSNETWFGDSNETSTVLNDQFQDLIKSVQLESIRMNPDELSSCILHLSKCRISPDVTRQLIQTYEDLICRLNDDEISVTSIARFTISVKEFGNIWSLYTLSNITPILYRKLDVCDDFDQFGKIIISLQRLIPLLNDSTVDKFVSKCSSLLQKQNDPTAEMSRSKCVVKVCQFLMNKHWHQRYVNLVKSLLLSLRGNIKYFHYTDLLFLHKIMKPLQEPHEIFNEIHETTFNLTTQFQDLADNVKLNLLNILTSEMHSTNADEMQRVFVYYLTKPLTAHEFIIQMKFLYPMLVTVDTKLSREFCDTYWNRVVSFLEAFPSLESKEYLLLIVTKYLGFIHMKRYRNGTLETALLSWLYKIFKDDGKTIYNPGSFVIIALSIVYFSRSRPNFTNDTWERILKCISLLNVQDNLSASFILNMTVRTTKKPKKLSSILQYYTNIISSLNNNSLAYLSSHNEMDIDAVNTIFRAYNYRDCAKGSKIFKLLCDRLNNTVSDRLCSKSIRDTVQNLSKCSHLEPDFVNKVVDYCIKEKNIIHTNLITHFLWYLFLFGYVPENCDALIETSLDLLNRNKEQLSRDRLVKAALSLCYINELPSNLTDYIFDVKFLNDWEEEVQCTFNDVSAIRHSFMELNRTVCVEYPHRDVPWFHGNYCREKLTLETHDVPFSVYHWMNVSECQHNNFFLNDVCDVLRGIVNVNKSIVENSLSPYYHKIDILFHTDRKGEPVDPNFCRPANLRKIAILLLEGKTSSSPYYQKKGTMELNARQLEMLDYKVVVIDKRLWYSMCMSEPLAKENYLCSRIWDGWNTGIRS